LPPAFRRQGFGSALANKIALTAKDLGVEDLYLQTEVLDGGFYRHIGWNIIENIICKDVLVAVMARKLSI
jgi:GNAT superfamily N-acetyltransferase